MQVHLLGPSVVLTTRHHDDPGHAQRLHRTTALDMVVPAIFVMTDLLLFSDVVFRTSGMPDEPTARPVVVAWALLGLVLLLARRSHPQAIAVLLAAHSVLACTTTTFRPVAMVCLGLVSLTRCCSGIGLLAGMLAVGGAGASWVLDERASSPVPLPAPTLVGIAAAYVTLLGAAAAVGRWRRTLMRNQQALRRRHRAALQDERDRLARDLHDTVAHGVTLMVLHADATQRSLGEASGAAQAGLEAIRAAGSATVSELRELVRTSFGGEPTAMVPGLWCLHDLAAVLRGFGRQLDVQIDAAAASLPIATQQDAYSIVRESLTNALKHSPADAAIQVRVFVAGQQLVAEVVNEMGTAQAAVLGQRLPSGRHGLAGLARRVEEAQGSFWAGAEGDRQFTVRATWPARRGAPPAQVPTDLFA